MGRMRRLFALTAFGALAIPPIVAGIAKSRYEVTGEDDDDLRVAAIFDRIQARITSAALRRGEAITWYGGLDVDLRGATLEPGGATLRVVVLFGGARIIVPTGWDVRVRQLGVFGGVDARLDPPTGSAPRLIIDAVAAFGGIQVTDRPAEEEPDVLIRGPLTEAEFAKAEAEAEIEAGVGRSSADADAEEDRAVEGTGS